jgi:uncharacterized protein YkwD
MLWAIERVWRGKPVVRTARARGSKRGSLRYEVLEARSLLAAPTGLEQEFLEWTNRLRMDPLGEFDRLIRTATPLSSDIPGVAAAVAFFNVNLGQLRTELESLTPVAPLLWSSALNDAARGHNFAMIAADEQSHQLPGEGNLGSRANAAGYTGWTALGENVFAYAQNVGHAHAGFVIDWGYGPGGMQDGRGHRVNIMSAAFRSVGIAVTPEANPSTEVGPLVVTQDFGASVSDGQRHLLGVVYADTFDNDFYTSGEGLGGITVRAVGAGGTFTTTTWSSGGYQMPVAPGSYTVTFSGGVLASPIERQVVVGQANTKLDLDTLAPDPSASFVQFAATVGHVTEGGGIDLLLLRSGNTSGEATVRLAAVAPSTASEADYEALPNGGVVTFAAGQTSVWVRLNTLEDQEIEGTETLVIALEPLEGASVVMNGRMTLFVADNDAAPIEPISIVAAEAVRTGRGTRQIAIQLAGDVDARTAARTTAYAVRRAGRDRRLGTRDDGRVGIARVRYDARTKTALLFLSSALRRGETVQLSLRGAVLRDLADRPPQSPWSVLVRNVAR